MQLGSADESEVFAGQLRSSLRGFGEPAHGRFQARGKPPLPWAT
jgi:hypothetical protein